MKKILLILMIIIVSCTAFIFYKNSKSESPFKKYAKLIPGTYRVGFTNLDKEVSIEKLEIVGKIPGWLTGTLLRNGPAKFTSNGSFVSNWFDGLAMLHAFSFNNGNVAYKNKFLKTNDYKIVQDTGKMSYAGFAQDPCKSYFKWFISIFVPPSKKSGNNAPNANINIAKLTDKFVALYETPLPIQFDPETLETLGVVNYDDKLPKSNIHTTAHPQYDPIRKEHIAYFTQFGRKSFHHLYKIKDGETKREIIASIPVEEPSYMHSFAITKNYAILTLLPLVVNPIDLLLHKKPFIENFKWKPELGTRLAIIDRINNKVVGIYKTNPFFAFHTVNAYEENNKIILDIIAHKKNTVLTTGSFNRILAPLHKKTKTQTDANAQDSENGRLVRYNISLSDGSVKSEQITEESVELPRINYERSNTKEYSYVYCVSKTKEYDNTNYPSNQLVKIDVKTGEVKKWHQKNCFPGEPGVCSKTILYY